MHEMSLAEGVRSIIEDAAATNGFDRVRRVILEIGELATVEVDALRFCLEVVLQDTPAAGASIVVEPIAGAGWCPVCATAAPMHARYEACPHCGSCQLDVTAGDEMRVKALDVD